MKLLTLGISTIESRYQCALSVLEKSRHLFDACVVVVQLSEKNEIQIQGETKFIFVSEAGLSRSRNLLLDHSDTKWLWINDDDVEINNEHVQVVRLQIRDSKSSDVILAGRIGCTGSSGCYKNYKYRWMKPLLYAQVSSVEMVLNRTWCIENSVRFDTNFGLGAPHPVAEEPVFAADVVNQGGAIRDINEIIVKHPCGSISEGASSSWNTSRLSYSRGKAAARISGWKGMVFLAFAILSSLIRGRSSSSLKNVLRGYFEKAL